MEVLMIFPKGRGGGAWTVLQTLTRILAARGTRVLLVLTESRRLWIADSGEQPRSIEVQGFRAQSTALIGLVRERDIDVIHTHLDTYQLGAYVGWRTGIVSLRTLHGRLDRPGMRSFREWVGTRIAVQLFGQKMVSVSRTVMEDVQRTYRFREGKTLFEIANGIECPVVPKKRPWAVSNGLRLLYTGRLEKPKGFHHLLDAVVALLREGAALNFMIAGDGPLRAGVPADLVERHQIELSEGWISAEQIRHYLQAADVFCLPSYSEGLSIALLEAMAHGVVPVVSQAANANDLVVPGSNGFVVQGGSTQALYEGLKMVLAQRSQLDGMAHKACQTVRESFSADLMADKYVDLYVELCRRMG